MSRKVIIYFSDGTVCRARASYSTVTGHYIFYPGNFCLVDPPNFQKLKQLCRLCQITGAYKPDSGKVEVFFCDTQSFWYVEPTDLVPAPCSASNN